MAWHRRMVDRLALLLAAGGPLVLAALLSWYLARPYAVGWEQEIPLQSVDVGHAADLSTLFEQLDYAWPPQGVVPPLAIDRFPVDLSQQEIAQKKSLFFRSLLPLVEAENARVLAQRRFLEERFAEGDLLPGSRVWSQVDSLAELYRVRGDLNNPQLRSLLLRRVDVVPTALVLAQAANESAWGNSRFCREANNLFGQWTYREELGIVPARRPEGANHFVRVFPDLRTSVREYLRNINIGHGYYDLRRMRARLRARGEEPDAFSLLDGLLRYSERGEAYVEDIRTMIEVNGLDRIGPQALQSS